jgi:uncharacterized membrane protein YuzA (DUF378 family)
MNAVILFLSTFGVVFFLSFQSLCVNSGRVWLAAVNSALIGIFNLLLFKIAPNISGYGEILAYVIGGPVGVCLAMQLHKILTKKVKFL